MNYKNEYTKNEYTLRMNYKLRNIATKKNHKKIVIYIICLYVINCCFFIIRNYK